MYVCMYAIVVDRYLRLIIFDIVCVFVTGFKALNYCLYQIDCSRCACWFVAFTGTCIHTYIHTYLADSHRITIITSHTIRISCVDVCILPGMDTKISDLP